MDDFFGFVASFIILGAIIAAFVFGIILIIPIGVLIVLGFWAYGQFAPNSQQKNNKLLIAETDQLYEQAKQITPFAEDEFSDFIKENVSRPELWSVAMSLYDMEGFKTPAPPPPIVTGIEGGRYRDEITRYINTSHGKDIRCSLIIGWPPAKICRFFQDSRVV